MEPECHACHDAGSNKKGNPTMANGHGRHCDCDTCTWERAQEEH